MPSKTETHEEYTDCLLQILLPAYGLVPRFAMVVYRLQKVFGKSGSEVNGT